MSKTTDYNKAELIAGRLTEEHITELVRYFQAHTPLAAAGGVVPDGMFGPKTRATLERYMGKLPVTLKPFMVSPLPELPSKVRMGAARVAKVTSAFRTQDRPNHNGMDFFYRWEPGDKPDFVGDSGCAGRDEKGQPKWVVPYGVQARAVAAGMVQIAGNSKTGYRVWIDHGNGWRTGYFHLLDLSVHVGDKVYAKQALGLVGDNPADHDGRHLHFELSPVDRYDPVDPEPYFL